MMIKFAMENAMAKKMKPFIRFLSAVSDFCQTPCTLTLHTSHGNFFVYEIWDVCVMNAGRQMQKAHSWSFFVPHNASTGKWNDRLLFILAKHVISYDNSKWRAADFIVHKLFKRCMLFDLSFQLNIWLLNSCFI